MTRAARSTALLLLLLAAGATAGRGRRAGGARHRLQPGLVAHRVVAYERPQLAVIELGLTVEETLTATTLNAAVTLGLGAEIGTLEVGKRADIVVLDAPNLLHLAYHYGVNPVRSVVKAGR